MFKIRKTHLDQLNAVSKQNLKDAQEIEGIFASPTEVLADIRGKN